MVSMNGSATLRPMFWLRPVPLCSSRCPLYSGSNYFFKPFNMILFKRPKPTKIINLALLLLAGIHFLHAQEIRLLEQGPDTSIRGLSLVDDQTAWVSGNNGWVGRSTDGGRAWFWTQ